MADTSPVTNVKDLTARVKQSIANIDAHRAAMQTVAALAKSNASTAAGKEVTPK